MCAMLPLRSLDSCLCRPSPPVFCFLRISWRCRVNDLESVNKAQKARLEALTKQVPDVEVSNSKFELFHIERAESFRLAVENQQLAKLFFQGQKY